MTRPELQSFLRSRYDRAGWLALLPKLLPTTEPWLQAQPLDFQDDAVVAAAQLGRIPLAGDRTVAVLEIRVAGQVDLQRNRAGLRNLVARFIGQAQADAVIAFFVGDSPDYRFTFAARTSAFTPDGQLQQRDTAPRRYTYLFGPGQPCRTALDRFELLRSLGPRAQLSDLIEAFKVEPLFKEFYREYGRVFDAVENHIRPSLSDKEPLRLFTQRLFNRLMFLAFVERKGWLRWEQRTDYLSALWDDYRSKNRTAATPGNFYADRLVPLFFEGLNQPGRPAGAADPRFGAVPYLNGGLFEYADDGTDRLPALRVPDDALALVLDPESGLFSRFNFTIAESTPQEINVAVDPEMLGKVFEELVTGRHEQGSYYTPKPIVAFMGRTALAEHLLDRCPAEDRAAIERFVHDDDAAGLRDPEAVHRALVEVKICDPACGSGAYLLGLLHELVELRSRLFVSRQKPDPESAYQRRLQIIERNLYGVDKDAFAVNIARLRLWLALAVEFEGAVPPPLPNLDFKIEAGDSLASLSPETVLRDEGQLIADTVRQFRQKKADYLKAHGKDKVALRGEIDHLKATLRGWLSTEGPSDAFHWAIEFAEVFMPEPATVSLSGGLNLGDELAPAAQPGGFDIIVANPPYVRMELIKPQKPVLRKRFPHVHAARADLYVYFYARAHELLRPGGVAAFISSNKWLRAGYGESLRQHLLDAQAFRLVMDFGDQPVFQSATAYPCIFVWQKKGRGDDATAWAKVTDLDRCYAEGVRPHFLAIHTPVPADQFGVGKPRLATSAGADLRSRMEQSGPHLGALFKGQPCRGVVTGFNDAFLIDQTTRDRLIAETPAAAEIIKPLLVGEDVRRYSLTYRNNYMIYAYHGVDIRRYPSIEKHLRPFRSFTNDKGKTVGLEHRATEQEWYELQQPQMAYREWFDQPKILYPEIGLDARFAMDEQGLTINNKAFFLPSADWFLLAVLNSSSVWSWITQTLSPLRGGYWEFRAQYLENLPIPDASAEDRKLVGDLAEQAQALHGRRRARCEQFLRDLGLDPSASTSRNPLEQPWSLAADDYAKRARKLLGRAPDLKIHETARDETAALTEQIAKIEAEIDARVAALYGLDAEDQRWATQSSPPVDAKQNVFFNLLGRLKERRAHFSLTEVQSAVNDAELSLTDGTLKVYLSEAVSKGLIHDAGRGWYSRLAEPLVLDPQPVRQLVRAVEKAFPLLDFSAWSTVQLNPWMHHLLAQPVHVLHVPREHLETVGDTLRNLGWEVSVNPGKQAATRDVRPGEKMVVLRPTHSKQPPAQDHLAAPEQTLVDLLVETEALSLMDTSEARAAALSAANSGLLNIADLKRFAEAKYLKWDEIWPVN
jgi:hypothetical protein